MKFNKPPLCELQSFNFDFLGYSLFVKVYCKNHVGHFWGDGMVLFVGQNHARVYLSARWAPNRMNGGTCALVNLING